MCVRICASRILIPSRNSTRLPSTATQERGPPFLNVRREFEKTEMYAERSNISAKVSCSAISKTGGYKLTETLLST